MFSIIIYIAYDSDVLRFSKKEDHRKLSKEEIDEIKKEYVDIKPIDYSFCSPENLWKDITTKDIFSSLLLIVKFLPIIMIYILISALVIFSGYSIFSYTISIGESANIDKSILIIIFFFIIYFLIKFFKTTSTLLILCASYLLISSLVSKELTINEIINKYTNSKQTKQATDNLLNSRINFHLSTKYDDIEVKDNHVVLSFYKSNESFDKEKIEKYKITLKRNGDEKELINNYIKEIQNDDNIVLSLKQNAVLNIKIYDSLNKINLLNNLYIRYSDVEDYWKEQNLRN